MSVALEQLITFLQANESISGEPAFEAYQDTRGKWTMGHGRTYHADGSKVKEGDVTPGNSPEEKLAFENNFLADDLTFRRNVVSDWANKNDYSFNDNQINALTSFNYNTDGRNQTDTLNSLAGFNNPERRDVAGMGEALMLYHKQKKKENGKFVRGPNGNYVLEPVDGLINRRGKEQDLFFGGDGTGYYSADAANLFTSDSNREKYLAALRTQDYYKNLLTAGAAPDVNLTTAQIPNISSTANNINMNPLNNNVVVPNLDDTMNLEDKFKVIQNTDFSELPEVPEITPEYLKENNIEITPAIQKLLDLQQEIKNVSKSFISREPELMSSGLPVSQGGADSDRFLMENDLMTPSYMDYLAKRDRKLKADAKVKAEEAAMPPPLLNDPRYKALQAAYESGRITSSKRGELLNELTGEADVVPAYLTPGEAVIPKEEAEKPENQKIINKMINDSREEQEIKDKEFVKKISRADAKKDRFNNESSFNLFDFLKVDGKPSYRGQGKRGMPENLGELNIPDRDALSGTVPPPMQGPVNKQTTPVPSSNKEQQEQLEKIDRIPIDPRIDGPIDNDKAIKAAQESIVENKGKIPKGSEQILGWIEENLGFTKKDAYRMLFYYIGGRLVGGSHAGSLKWAGRKVVEDVDKREALAAKAATTTQGQMLTYYKGLAEDLIKGGGLTGVGKRKLQSALNKADLQSMMTVINDDKNYSAIGRVADVSKPTEVFRLKGFENNTIMAYPATDGTGFFYHIDPNSQKIIPLNPSEYRKFSADIMDNIKSWVSKDYNGVNENKLKSVFNIETASGFANRLRKYAEEVDIPTEELVTYLDPMLAATSLPEGFGEKDFKPKEYKSLEATLDMLRLEDGKQPDLNKLTGVNQKNINEMVTDFGSATITTNVLQAADTELTSEGLTAGTIDDKKQAEAIKASGLKPEQIAKIMKQPNAYWRLAYLLYYKNPDKFKE